LHAATVRLNTFYNKDSKSTAHVT